MPNFLPPGLRGYMYAQDQTQRSNANNLGMLSGLAGLQAQMEQQALQREIYGQKMAEQQQRQAAMGQFAQQLPEGERAAFMLSPDTFIKERFAPYTLGPSQQRFVGGQSIASVAPEQKLVDLPVPDKPGVTQQSWLRPGEATGTPVGGPKMPEILNPDVQRAKISIAQAGRPSVNVRIDNKTGESFAKEVGPMMVESRTAAAGSVQAVETANRINAALSSGNVTIGPAATVRNSIDQISQTLGIAGENTEERLVNTRNVGRGLAQLTVAARKALKGQGQVSDFEGRLLERAESGQIDTFTIPELKNFVSLTERLARQQYAEHARNLEVMNQNENLRGLAAFYAVPELPPPTTKDAGKPSPQQVVDELRRRGVIK